MKLFYIIILYIRTDYLACFSRYGEKIYFGSSKGNIHVYDLNMHKVKKKKKKKYVYNIS